MLDPQLSLETDSHYSPSQPKMYYVVAKAVFKLVTTLLPQPSEDWKYRHPALEAKALPRQTLLQTRTESLS